MPQDIAGYLLHKGYAHAIKSGRSRTNPLTDWFMGIQHNETDFTASDDGLTKAYLASLWAYRCISLRGKKVSGIPLLVKTSDDQYVDRTGRPVDDMPSRRMNQHILQAFLGTGREKLRRLIEYDMCIWGRAFIETTQRGLVRLNPTTMIIDKDTRNGIEGFRQNINGQTVAQWAPDELVYIYDFDPSDDLAGLSPLAFVLQHIGSEVNVDTFVSSFFANDATPTGLLTTEQPVTKEQVDEITGWWNKLFAGVSNKFKVGIAGSGLKFEQITSDIANLAIPELRLEVRREICAVFGVPMTIAGADEAANYSCIVTGELVSTPDGPLPIEEVVPGDKVYTWADGESHIKPVEAVIKQPNPVPVYRITTRWHSLRASNNHMILCPDTRQASGYCWQRTDELRPGDWIITCDEPGTFAAETVRHADYIGEHDVWDLCIKDDHTFIAQGIVVHNTSAEQHQALYTETIIPEVELIVSELNRQLVPRFDRTGNLKIVADISGIEVLQKAKVDLSTRYSGLYVSGVYSLNEARKAEGMAPLDKDYYNVPNVGLVAADDMPQVAARAIAPPPDNGGFGGGMASVPVPDPDPPPQRAPLSLPVPVLEAAPKATIVTPIQTAHVGSYSVMPGRPSAQPTPMKAVGRAAYVTVPLAGNPAIAQIQSAVRTALGNDAVDWYTDNRWHCTLVSCEGVPDSSLGQICKEIELREPVALVPDGVGVLDGGNAPALVVFLRKEPSLVALQRSAYAAFGDRDLPVSPFSKPSRYRPHVTLGTIKPGREAEDVPDVPTDIVEAHSVQVSRDDYQAVCEIELPPFGAKSGMVAPSVQQAAAVADLRRFENKLLLKGTKAKFIDSAIPGPIMFFLRGDLDAGDGTPVAIKAAVETAVQTLQQTNPQDLADFLEYWKDIDEHAGGLVDTLGDIVANPELLKELGAHIEETGSPDTAVSAFMDGITDKQVEQLVGTEDAPGPLTAIMLAGVGRGEQLLGKLEAANQAPVPKRSSRKANKVEVDVRYDMLHKQAFDWARAYAYDLVKGINATTAQTFKDTFSDWITKGGSLPGLVDVLHGRLQGLDVPPGWNDAKLRWATSRERARVIAQTESTRAFTHSNINTWASKGYVNSTWRTQRDRAVCDGCQDMNGTIGTADKGYAVPSKWVASFGTFVKMPAHPGCILPGQTIDAPGSILAAAKSHYVGRCVELRVANGSVLRVTQNHPVWQVEKGWVPAISLHKGDKVIVAHSSHGITKPINPDNNDSPPTIDEIFRSLKMSGEMSSVAVPVSPIDFHGDGAHIKGDIDIVYANRLLLGDDYSSLEQSVSQLGFDRGYMTRVEPILLSNSPAFKFVGGGCSSLAGSMCFVQHLMPFLRTGLLPARQHAVRNISGRDTSPQQVASKSAAINTHSERERLLGFAGEITRFPEIPVSGDDQMLRNGHTSLNEGIAEGGGRDADLARQYIDRFAGQVTTSEVIDIDVFEFAGHVYDLQVDVYEVYTCNGVLVKNCRCFPSPVASSRQFPMEAVAPEIAPERQTADSLAIGGQAARIG